MNINWKKIIISIIIFIASIISYYYPIYSKGFAPGADFSNLAQARNFAVVGDYNYESEDGVFLSSDKLEQEAKATGMKNPLTSVIYGYIFKIFGYEGSGLLLPQYISIFLAAIFNVIIFLLIASIFNLTTGIFSSTLLILMPTRVMGAIYYSSYEFAMIFFAIALWFYFKSNDIFNKNNIIRLIFASLFFSLAALSRNAFLISFIPFAIYDLIKCRSFKRSLVFVIPFIIIFGATLTPFSWLGVPNGYTTDMDQQPFAQIGHVFNDPYSAYYDRDNFINEFKDSKIERIGVHFLDKWGYEVSFWEKINAYKESISYYIKDIFSLTSTGGPIILFLVFLGIFKLFETRKDILGLFVLWIAIWLISLVYYKTGNWNHLLEIIFIFATLTGLGVQWLIDHINLGSFKKYFFGAILLLSILGHLSYANWWRLYDTYRSSHMGITLEISEKINEIEINGRVAVGIHTGVSYGVYYFTDKDIIYFNPNTIKKLIKENKLKEAMELYDVGLIVGYSPEISTIVEEGLGIPTIKIE